MHTTTPHQWNLGPHAVISLGKDGKLRINKTGHEEEMKQLTEEYKLPQSRAGITTLKERLQPLFANLIKQNLPKLKQSVSNRLDETLKQLESVGKEPPLPIEIMFKCQTCLLDKVEDFQKELTTSSFLPTKQKIFSVKKDITMEFATKNFKLNSFECILFQGKATFDEVTKEIRALWEPILMEYIKDAKDSALNSIHVLRSSNSTAIYASLISIFHAECKLSLSVCMLNFCTLLWSAILLTPCYCHLDQEYLPKNVLPRFHEARPVSNVFTRKNSLARRITILIQSSLRMKYVHKS